jgi:hypothetical protein
MCSEADLPLVPTTTLSHGGMSHRATHGTLGMGCPLIVGVEVEVEEGTQDADSLMLSR